MQLETPLLPEFEALRHIIQEALDFNAEISDLKASTQKEILISAFHAEQLTIEQAQAIYNHLKLKDS